MCGTPNSSRNTSTCALSPGTEISPDSWGNGLRTVPTTTLVSAARVTITTIAVKINQRGTRRTGLA